MPYTWHAVDTLTGRRGPQMQVSTNGSPSVILNEPTDLQMSVLCWDVERARAVPEWRQWTQPGRSSMVLVDEEDTPVWVGDIVRRIPDETIWVPLTLVTTESYLDRRYPGGKSYSLVEQAEIARSLISAAYNYGPSNWVFEITPTNVARDRAYLDADDKTVLSLLTDLSNLESPIEFTVYPRWNSTHEYLSRVWQVGPHVGTSLPEPVRFDHPGCVSKFNVTEDFTKDNGANDVMAVSSGEGDVRPQSSHYTTYETPRYERRFTPSTSITDIATLNSYARAELYRTSNGLTEISLVADLDTAPKLNRDWWLGDDIFAVITAPAYPPRRGPDNELLPGYERVVRVVGWTIDLDARTLTPNLREYA